MKSRFTDLKNGDPSVTAALSAARSARNQSTRRGREQDREAGQLDRQTRKKRAREDRAAAKAISGRVTVKMSAGERPRSRNVTPRARYYRAVGRGFGVTGWSGSFANSETRAIHFAVTARGFASTTGRTWRSGEGERAAQYVTREQSLEGGEDGWWSNIAADRNELVAFYRTSEALEKLDRKNANVYISEVISLPASLSAEQRRDAIKRYIKVFERRGLPVTVAMHRPDPSGDQRNYHAHILYSLRPTRHVATYHWDFAVSKRADVNTPDRIFERRKHVVTIINAALHEAGSLQRYTHLSNKDRGLPRPGPKVGQVGTWTMRRLETAETRDALLARLQDVIAAVQRGLMLHVRVDQIATVATERLLAQRDIDAARRREQDRGAARLAETVRGPLQNALTRATPPRSLEQRTIAAGGVFADRYRRKTDLQAALKRATTPGPDFSAIRGKALATLQAGRQTLLTSRAAAAAEWNRVKTPVVAADHPRLSADGNVPRQSLRNTVAQVVPPGSDPLPGLHSLRGRARTHLTELADDLTSKRSAAKGLFVALTDPTSGLIDAMDRKRTSQLRQKRVGMPRPVADAPSIQTADPPGRGVRSERTLSDGFGDVPSGERPVEGKPTLPAFAVSDDSAPRRRGIDQEEVRRRAHEKAEARRKAAARLEAGIPTAADDLPAAEDTEVLDAAMLRMLASKTKKGM